MFKSERSNSKNEDDKQELVTAKQSERSVDEFRALLSIVSRLYQSNINIINAFTSISKDKNAKNLSSAFEEMGKTIKNTSKYFKKDNALWKDAKEEATNCLQCYNRNEKSIQDSVNLLNDLMPEDLATIDKEEDNYCTICNERKKIEYKHPSACKLCCECINKYILSYIFIENLFVQKL